MKKLFYMLGCLLVLSSSPVLAQTEPEIAVVRIDFSNRQVIITRGEGKSEVTDFTLSMGLKKRSIEGNELYYRTIKRLQQEGYTLQQRLDDSTTLLFIKAPKS
jgi:hypothetical protein